MRVICIDDRDQPDVFQDLPKVKRGNVYTVIDVKKSKEIIKDGIRYYAGEYYILAECGDVGYHHSLFLAINEDQQDELELVNKKEEVV